jgi:hypothetical protein
MKKFTLFLSALLISMVSFAETATLTFTAQCAGAGTDDKGNAWTITSDAAESNFDNTKGIHYGTGKKEVSYLQVSTDEITEPVKKIVVNASGASNTKAKLNVTVGGNPFGEEVALTKVATEYTFEGDATGEIVVKLTQSSAKCALYVKSVAVSYGEGDDQPGDDPDQPGNDDDDEEDKPTTSGAVCVLVEDVANLHIGDQVVIAAAESDVALSTTQNNNNRGQVAITKKGNTIIINDDVQVLTLEEGNIDGTFAFYTGEGYLYAASSSSNHLKTQEELSDNSSWQITITDAVASVVAQGTNTRNVMQYNQNSSLFSCYASASQKPIAIYILDETTPSAIDNVTVNQNITKFFENGQLVIIKNGVRYNAQGQVSE